MSKGYNVAIRNNATGEIRMHHQGHSWSDRDAFFNWTEGNYGCDCNREFFWRLANGEDPNLRDMDCSDGRFSALYAELDDGSRVMLDEELQGVS